jgi:hypothetical protein
MRSNATVGLREDSPYHQFKHVRVAVFGRRLQGVLAAGTGSHHYMVPACCGVGGNTRVTSYGAAIHNHTNIKLAPACLQQR